MRKAALVAVLTIAAMALPATSQAAKKAAADPAVAAQQNTSDFMRAALNPYEATMAKPAAAKGKKKH